MLKCNYNFVGVETLGQDPGGKPTLAHRFLKSGGFCTPIVSVNIC